MNTSKSLMVLGSLVLMLVGGISSSSAQTDRQSKASLRDNAIRDARKEAKSYEKQGYATMVGRLPMDKQIEAAWIAQTKRNEGGEPAFYIATAKAVGGSYGAAKLQADNHAKLDIAGQVGAALAQIIESKVVNNDMGEGDVETLNNMISASKAVIAQNLGRTYTYVEIFRNTAKGATEVMVTVGYDTKSAIAEAKRVLRKKLEAEGATLSGELDQYLKVE